MKKVIMTLAMVLSMGLYANAQSLLNRDGNEPDRAGDITTPSIMAQHGLEGDQTSPLGSGLAVLVSLGAAYMVSKKRKED